MRLPSTLVLTILFCLIFLGCEAQSVELAPVFSEAQKENKNVFVYIHASWCVACRMMEKYVFPAASVKDQLNDYVFISTSLDSGKLGKVIAKKYGITAAPVFLLLSPKFGLLHCYIGGSADTVRFLKMLTDFKEDGQIPGFSGDFSQRYPSFYESFFTSFRQAADSSMICRYLDSQTELQSEVNFDILGTMPLCRKYYTYFLANFRSFSALYGPLYWYQVEQFYLSSIGRIIQEKDTVSYVLLERALYHVDSLKGNNRDWLKELRYLQFLGRSGLDWVVYKRRLERWVTLYGDKQLANFCTDVNGHCTDPNDRRKLAMYCPLPANQ